MTSQSTPAPVISANPPTRQRIWRALRVQKTCDPIILAMAAGAPETSAREYLRLLVRGGYARIITRGNGRTGRLNKYQLVRDTGPRAPRRVFDFLQDENTSEMFPLTKAQSTRRPALQHNDADMARDVGDAA